MQRCAFLASVIIIRTLKRRLYRMAPCSALYTSCRDKSAYAGVNVELFGHTRRSEMLADL